MYQQRGMRGERILSLEPRAAESMSLDSAPVPVVQTRALTSSREHEEDKNI